MTTSSEWARLSADARAVIEKNQISVPVDLVGIAQGLGVKIKATTPKPGISGELRPDGTGGYVIRVNRHDASYRQRFTVAHEIAHFLLHRDRIGDGIYDDVLYRSRLSDQIESEANRLAADILMPMNLVLRYAKLARELGSEDVARDLALRFNVSEQAMGIRLGIKNRGPHRFG